MHDIHRTDDDELGAASGIMNALLLTALAALLGIAIAALAA